MELRWLIDGRREQELREAFYGRSCCNDAHCPFVFNVRRAVVLLARDTSTVAAFSFNSSNMRSVFGSSTSDSDTSWNAAGTFFGCTRICNVTLLDSQTAKGFVKILNSESKRKSSGGEKAQAQKGLALLTGRQISFMICAFKINDAKGLSGLLNIVNCATTT